MDNQKVVEEKAVETDITQDSSPQSESPITGDETIQGEDVVQTPVVEEADDTKGMTEEQRRAFQEQRLEIKRLKEERETQPDEESAFDAFRAPTPPVSSGPVDVQQFTDPITGETNWQGFNQAQQQREQQILQQARAEANQTVEERLDEERARAKFPDLFSNPATEKAIAAQWFMDSKFAGKPVSITQVASEFARNFKQAVSKAEKIGAERVLNEVSEKEQAGLNAQSQSSQGQAQATSQEEAERLSVGTRRGNDDAITARLSKIPWANK